MPDDLTRNPVSGLRTNHAPDDIIVVTTPKDAPTIFVDGIKGIGVFSDTMRISFTESYLNTTDNRPESRHVITLAIPMSSMRASMELLNSVMSDLDGPTAP